jgi:outer membrane lipoprotein-sorting protein
LSLIRIAIGCFFIAVGSMVTFAQEPTESAVHTAQDIFKLFSEGRGDIESMQARFTQMTMTPEEDIESTGSIVYVSPKRIIFRYDDPPIAYMIDESNFYEYDEELEQFSSYDIQGRPEAEAFFLGLSNNTEKVKESYDLELLPAENPETDAFSLQLVPIPVEGEESIFEKVTLQLRKGDFLPAKVHIVNGEDSQVFFSLEGFVLNEDLPRDLSHVFVPEDTDLLIDDVALDPVGPGGRYLPKVIVSDSDEPSDDE